MKKAILIADSGGTQTDWCFIDEDRKRYSFTTESFHPVKWNEDFFQKFKEFWKDRPEMLQAKVHFYGAGCLHEFNKKRLTEYFLKWNFEDVTVLSDIHAACHALLGNEKGNVAILGTGSVFCSYDGHEVMNLQGGLGYLIGDEGSGFYFGKMLLSDYLNGSFDADTTKSLFELLGDRTEVLKKVYGENGKDYISSMSVLTNALKQTSNQVLEIHKKNINFFIEKYIFKKSEISSTISFVGSYAFFNRDILFEILQNHNYSLKNTLQYPIDSLTDYIEKMTL